MKISSISIYGVNTDGTIDVRFYSQNSEDQLSDCSLVLKSDGVTPDYFHAKLAVAKIGTKITIEVAANGFILKSGRDIRIVTDSYPLSGTIEKMSYDYKYIKVPATEYFKGNEKLQSKLKETLEA